MVNRWNDQDSDQTFTDFMSSGSDYIPSENSYSSLSSDNDSLKCVTPQINEITNISMNNNFDFEKSIDQNYNCSSEHLVPLQNSSKQKINAKGLKSNEDNQMTVFSLQTENDPKTSDKSGLKVIFLTD